MLLNRVPIVLTADVYAVAALAGAAVVVIGQKLGWARSAGLAAGAAACFALRIVSVTQHWNLPRVHT